MEHHPRKHNRPFCEDIPVHCHFELVDFPKGQTIHNADQTTHYLVFCQRGHLKISCTSFRDEIIAMEMLYAYLTVRIRAIQQQECEHISTGVLNVQGKYRWTGSAVELVELVYGLEEMQSVNGGDVPVQELVTFIATSFGMEVKDCYSAYTDMKRRKNDSRTYFFDKMRERLNRRMEQDDERGRGRR